MATWNSDGSPGNIIAILNASTTLDGDTITMPAGTFNWNTPSGVALNSKSITIQGSTTVNTVTKAFNDQTIILDNITTNWTPLFGLGPSAGKTVRVSGVTIKPGTRGYFSGGAINIGGHQGNGAYFRIDNSHFYGTNRDASFYCGGAAYGVIDHNLISYTPASQYTQTFNCHMPNWNGDTNGAGDGSFADYPWFGTEKFIFLEDNCIDNQTSLELQGTTDGYFGGRWVLRHNHFYNVTIQGHGTEGRYRGFRAEEVYNNDVHWSFAPSGIASHRSGGSSLWHDNTYDGVIPQYGGGVTLSCFRSFFQYGGDPGGATGINVWDVNVTEADGTHVDGHAPYLFASGTVTSAAVIVGDDSTLTDSNANWIPGQFAPDRVNGIQSVARRISDNKLMEIESNTATVMHGLYRAEQGGGANWQVGDQYEIHKVLIAMDQPSRGKCDLLQGGYDQGGQTVNTVTGNKAWPHQVLEPVYSWNNFYTPSNTRVMDFQPFRGTPLVPGRDYFSNSSAAAAQAKYTAALNGVQYGGPYTYPHPLVSGTPIPAPSISSPLSASGTVGVAFSYQSSATNGPTSFAASPLPGGLSINTLTGLISGTPTTAGITNVTLSATNATGTGTAIVVINVQTQVITQFPPVISSPTTASGIQNTVFSYQIVATQNPTSYSATGLPAGLAVNSGTGLISGTPTAVAVTNITIGATNVSGTGNATLVLTVTAAAPTPVGRHPKRWKKTLLRRRQR